MSPNKTSNFLALRANVHFANFKYFFLQNFPRYAPFLWMTAQKPSISTHFSNKKFTNPQTFLVKIHDNFILRLHETTPRGLETTEIFLGEAPRPPSARHTSIYVAAHIYCVLQFCTITNSSGFCFIWKWQNTASSSLSNSDENKNTLYIGQNFLLQFQSQVNRNGTSWLSRSQNPTLKNEA